MSVMSISAAPSPPPMFRSYSEPIFPDHQLNQRMQNTYPRKDDLLPSLSWLLELGGHGTDFSEMTPTEDHKMFPDCIFGVDMCGMEMQMEPQPRHHSPALSMDSTPPSSPIMQHRMPHNNQDMMLHRSELPLMRTQSHDTLLGNSNTGNSAPAPEIPKHEKPPYSFPCLIGLALMSKGGGKMAVSEIYQYICEHFPYFITAKAGWKNSVRHNLSLNKFFCKAEREKDDQGKGNLWTVAPNMEDLLSRDIKNCEQKYPKKLELARAKKTIQAKCFQKAAPTPLMQNNRDMHCIKELRDPRLSDSVFLQGSLPLSHDVFGEMADFGIKLDLSFGFSTDEFSLPGV